MICASGSMAIPICDVVATYLCIVSRTLLYDLVKWFYGYSYV